MEFGDGGVDFAFDVFVGFPADVDEPRVELGDRELSDVVAGNRGAIFALEPGGELFGGVDVFRAAAAEGDFEGVLDGVFDFAAGVALCALRRG